MREREVVIIERPMTPTSGRPCRFSHRPPFPSLPVRPNQLA